MLGIIIALVVGVLIGVVIGGKKSQAAAPVPAAKPVPEAAPVAAAASEKKLKAEWLSALGGASNVRKADNIAATRVRLELADASKINESALQKSGVQAVARLENQVIHLIVGLTTA